MITFAICDDNKEFAKRFELMILAELKSKNNMTDNVRCIYYENLKEILNNFDKDAVDIYFLDIEYGDTIGMDVARILNAKNEDIGIVYVTNHGRYVNDAFVCRPLGFIRKELINQDIKMALASVCEYIRKYKKVIVFENGKNNIKINLDYIRYIQMYDHIMQIVSKEGNIEIRDKISRVEKNLIQNGFVKINRSCIVNTKCIKDIVGIEVILFNGEKLYASEDRKKDVLLKWQLYKMKS